MTYLFEMLFVSNQIYGSVTIRLLNYYWTFTLTYAPISFSTYNRKPLLFPLLTFFFENNICAFSFNNLVECGQFLLLKGSFKSFKVEKTGSIFAQNSVVTFAHTLVTLFLKTMNIKGILSVSDDINLTKVEALYFKSLVFLPHYCYPLE